MYKQLDIFLQHHTIQLIINLFYNKYASYILHHLVHIIFSYISFLLNYGGGKLCIGFT